VFSVVETAIPNLPLEIVGRHINEDAVVSRQAIEGAAESGSMGGEAPRVNQEEDIKIRQEHYNMFEKVIKDVNFVYYNLDPHSYEIEFNKPPELERLEYELTQYDGGPNHDKDKKPEEPKEEEFRVENEAHLVNSKDFGISHSISKKYITFEGNMFQSGLYKYPENKGTDKEWYYYSPEDIKSLTEREVKEGYIEYDHSFDADYVALNEGVGYYQIIGYDDLTTKDKTLFHIKKKEWENMGRPNKIKTSPYFSRIKESEGHNKLYVKNVAIVPPDKTPRSELTNLETGATLINKEEN